MSDKQRVITVLCILGGVVIVLLLCFLFTDSGTIVATTPQQSSSIITNTPESETVESVEEPINAIVDIVSKLLPISLGVVAIIRVCFETIKLTKRENRLKK